MSKSKPTRRAPNGPEAFEVCHPNAAGIDIGSREIWVSVPPSRDAEPVRPFETFTTDLRELADWLSECHVDSVAMESTGVYWVPLYEILEERGFEVFLVNSYEVKAVPGRKSDVLDCQWLRRLHTHGLLRRSFRPSAEVVEFRQYLRLRQTHVEDAANCTRRIHKTLTLMNLQLHNVISDVTGMTGLAILRAIVAGERDPKVLAEHRDPRCRASAETIEASLTGNYQPEHLLALDHALHLYDLHQQLIAECDRAAQKCLLTLVPQPALIPQPKARKRRPKEATVDYASPLGAALGVDLTTVPGFSDLSAATYIAEIGTDMSHWPTDRHFCSWLRLCPRTDITGGKPKSRRPLPTTSRATQILRMAAVNAGRTDTALGASYRSVARRKGRQQAVVATAHKLARITYAMIRNGASYEDLGAQQWEDQHRERALRRLHRQAERLGMTVHEATPEVPTAGC